MAHSQCAVSDPLCQAPNDPLGGQDRRATEEHRELISADPSDQVAVPNALLEDRPYPNQGFVARRVAKVVVQGLQAVRVDDRDRQRSPLATRDLSLEALEEGPPVRQPGQRVGGRRGLRGLVQLGDPDGRRDLMRDRGEEILVLAAERAESRALDAQGADAFVAQLERNAEH